jgi:hypothetical protein
VKLPLIYQRIYLGTREGIHRHCRGVWLASVSAFPLWQPFTNFKLYLVGDSLVLLIFPAMLGDLNNLKRGLVVFTFEIAHRE